MSKHKSYNIDQLSYLNDFTCAADKCPDTCCSQWIINITSDNKKFYEQENKEIDKDVESHSDGDFRMKEHANGDCIQLKKGLCSLQMKFGPDHLPDVCHTFPRSYKQIENNIYMTANLACPESLRVALYNNKINDFSSWSNIETARVSKGLYDSRSGEYANFSDQQTINIFNNITKMIDDPDYSSDEALAKLVALAARMDQISDFNWNNIEDEIQNIKKGKILKISEKTLPHMDMRKEMFNVLRAMFDLVNRDRPRYNVLIKVVREVLGDHNSNEDELIERYQKIYDKWQISGDKFDRILKNLIKAQISYALFPIGSYSKKYNTAATISLEYLVIKLTLMVKIYELDNDDLTQAQMIDIVQPVAKRFYVRGSQELYNFCDKSGWGDFRNLITVILNFA